jgi:hypothetical protein
MMNDNRGAVSSSFSGYERNHLFVNEGGKSFVDLSAVSGLDSPCDSRSFAVLDYDRDGWPDIALVNANAPLFELFRNEFGDSTIAADREVLAVTFVGGNQTAQAAPGRSCRDGYGAVVTVELDDKRLIREYRCGEGFAAQNSSTLLIGIGDHPSASRVTVRWPSGKTSQVDIVAAGTLLTVYEDPSQAPDGQSWHRGPYVIE